MTDELKIKPRPIVRRGYHKDDNKIFNDNNLIVLKKAAEEYLYLLNRGYKCKTASVFVCNHYMLTERQRLLLARAISCDESITKRRIKEKKEVKGETVYVDGFNAIIPIETALSECVLLDCMDGTIRDLANLRGSYKLIDKTETAVKLVIKELKNMEISKAVFLLDSPVSNSGRLKTLIAETAEQYELKVDIKLLPHVDVSLYNKENVITGDSVILDNCISWVNLDKRIVEKLNAWIIKII